MDATGDTGVLDEMVPFIEGREVAPKDEAYYDQPQRSTESATLYEHCVRAIEHGLRFGRHGLPLMGSGDWNDGMNRVGSEGKGESVWLAWFLCDNLRLFAELAGDAGRRRFAGPVRDTRREAARAHRGARLGRRVVPPRLLRRRHAAGLGEQRRMPHRLDQPELGRDLRGWRPRARAQAMDAVDNCWSSRDAGLDPAARPAL